MGRFGDLVALGLSRKQIADACAAGELRIVKRSPSQGHRYFDMRDAYRLLGMAINDDVVPLADLHSRIDLLVTKALQERLPALVLPIVQEDLARRSPILAQRRGLEVPIVSPRPDRFINDWSTRGGGTY